MGSPETCECDKCGGPLTDKTNPNGRDHGCYCAPCSYYAHPRHATPTSRRFRRNEDGRLRLVAGTINGVEYYDCSYTTVCSGCHCDCGGGYPCSHGASGCRECGYTGKRVRHFPVAFDPAETERMHGMELPTAASGDSEGGDDGR